MFGLIIYYIDASDGESRMGSGMEFQMCGANTLEEQLAMDVLVGG